MVAASRCAGTVVDRSRHHPPTGSRDTSGNVRQFSHRLRIDVIRESYRGTQAPDEIFPGYFVSQHSLTGVNRLLHSRRLKLKGVTFILAVEKVRVFAFCDILSSEDLCHMSLLIIFNGMSFCQNNLYCAFLSVKYDYFI